MIILMSMLTLLLSLILVLVPGIWSPALILWAINAFSFITILKVMRNYSPNDPAAVFTKEYRDESMKDTIGVLIRRYSSTSRFTEIMAIIIKVIAIMLVGASERVILPMLMTATTVAFWYVRFIVYEAYIASLIEHE